ncbi:unnamed protein product [Bursaphelenchus okinawaensis]|uniref:Methanethiol oxidase n=1 Tax=Bursaphelenchus okinawaensis TaxID=465554 RepID=A0A811LQE0_9BILA|nr:unnamed protein product [Bursaphelenchus okinawaensis]CAG9127867.1 unnamed protein product [Bursaphelenchus okinawaensis]
MVFCCCPRSTDKVEAKKDDKPKEESAKEKVVTEEPKPSNNNVSAKPNSPPPAPPLPDSKPVDNPRDSEEAQTPTELQNQHESVELVTVEKTEVSVNPEGSETEENINNDSQGPLDVTEDAISSTEAVETAELSEEEALNQEADQILSTEIGNVGFEKASENDGSIDVYSQNLTVNNGEDHGESVSHGEGEEHLNQRENGQENNENPGQNEENSSEVEENATEKDKNELETQAEASEAIRRDIELNIEKLDIQDSEDVTVEEVKPPPVAIIGAEKPTVPQGTFKFENDDDAPVDSDASSQNSRRQSMCDGTAKRNIRFTTPAEARRSPKERYLFVTCINTNDSRKPDALMTVDVNPDSRSFGEIVCKLPMPNTGDELHHSGWNACAGCKNDETACRSHLVLPCLHSSNIYIVDTENPRDLKLHKEINHKDLSHLNVTFLHTSHCLPSGDILISTLGDNTGKNKGDMILLDSKTFQVKKSWCNTSRLPKFHYDFWYQPRLNVLISTEWGNPKVIKDGFDPKHVTQGYYGNSVHIWDYTTGRPLQCITLDGPTGYLPLEVRFKHKPTEAHAFVGTALGSAIYHIYQEDPRDPWQHELSIAIPSKEVDGWILPKMPALVTDIIISMDDKYLYVACWLFGEVRQYNIKDPFNIKLTGRACFGGLIHSESDIKVTNDPEGHDREAPLRIRHTLVQGGPQMMQLSLDGRRLYVTNSLYSVWDKQFYPELPKHGGQMLKIDVDVENGGIQVDPLFLVDFGKVKDGPYCPHEMRYPGGDCTSDIFV